MKLLLFKREMGIYAGLDMALHLHLPPPFPSVCILLFPPVCWFCVFHYMCISPASVLLLCLICLGCSSACLFLHLLSLLVSLH